MSRENCGRMGGVQKRVEVDHIGDPMATLKERPKILKNNWGPSKEPP